jgi:hypothetical protein
MQGAEETAEPPPIVIPAKAGMTIKGGEGREEKKREEDRL